MAIVCLLLLLFVLFVLTLFGLRNVVMICLRAVAEACDEARGELHRRVLHGGAPLHAARAAHGVGHGEADGHRRVEVAARDASSGAPVRPVSLLRISLLRFVDSNFPRNPLWT